MIGAGEQRSSNKPSREDRELGMLLGLHAGDALGATLEFKSPREESEWLRDIVGGGGFNWRPGQATDDTDLMLCLLEAIGAGRDAISWDELKENLLRWFTSGPIDIGHTTRMGLNLLRRGLPLHKCGSTDENSQGNGSLMRCAPLALLKISSAELRSVVKTQASITHAHPRCVAADLILIEALRSILSGSNKSEVWGHSLSLASEIDGVLYSALRETPGLAWEELGNSGYVVDTLVAGFWGLLHGKEFESALIKVTNRGNDADTCGAVAGALCGAYYGVEGIPSRWLAVLEEKERIRDCLRLLGAE